MKLKHNCPKCNRPAEIQAEFPLGKLINYVYRCGHVELRNKLVVSDVSELNTVAAGIGTQSLPRIEEATVATQKLISHYDELDSWVCDGGAIKGDIRNTWVDELPRYMPSNCYSHDLKKKLYDFQFDGVNFAESTELNCLIADAMGLGKTVQALVALRRNKQVATPALLIVKGATIFQWAHEITEWYNADFTSMVPITSRSQIIPGFDLYILSMDMLGKDDIIEKLLTLGLKCVVIDEVQNFKDPSAKRSIGLIKLIELAKIQYKIALSGTPIKNRVTEYFTILNILAPQYFGSYNDFKQKWLKPEVKINGRGREIVVYSRLDPYRSDEFFKLTSKWIIRREKHEVLKNLPTLTRDYQIIEINDPNIKSSYNRTVDLFANFLRDNKTGIKSQALLGWLQQLRSITGQAKCANAIEWTNDFLESTDESLAIGIQHHSVRDLLHGIFSNAGIKVLKLSGEDDVYRKADIVRQFTNGAARVLVVNSLAGGVGLNLQSCAQALVLERQWNSADEEQFESRFHRNGQQKAVTITYLIAKGTIDEFFHNMVEDKRKILINAGIGTSWDLNTDLESLLQFAEIVASHKL